MGEVVDIEDAMPHLMVVGISNEAHIMPMATMQDVIDRKMDITDIEGYERFLPEILAEWLSLI